MVLIVPQEDVILHEDSNGKCKWLSLARHQLKAFPHSSCMS